MQEKKKPREQFNSVGAMDESLGKKSASWQDAVPEDRLSHIIRATLRGLTRCLQVRLAEHSISIGHWVFLRILWERDGLTQRQLSELAGLMDSTTATALKALENLGHVERSRSAGKKAVRVWLTDTGHSLKPILVPLALQANEIATRKISKRDIEVVRRVLLHMIANLAQDEESWLAENMRLPSTRELSQKKPNLTEGRKR